MILKLSKFRIDVSFTVVYVEKQLSTKIEDNPKQD